MMQNILEIKTDIVWYPNDPTSQILSITEEDNNYLIHLRRNEDPISLTNFIKKLVELRGEDSFEYITRIIEYINGSKKVINRLLIDTLYTILRQSQHVEGRLFSKKRMGLYKLFSLVEENGVWKGYFFSRTNGTFYIHDLKDPIIQQELDYNISEFKVNKAAVINVNNKIAEFLSTIDLKKVDEEILNLFIDESSCKELSFEELLDYNSLLKEQIQCL